MTTSNGFVQGGPLILLRCEGGAAFAAATLAFAQMGQSFWLFAALILAPDISMLGYLVNARFGAACYNAAHWAVPPLMLACAGASIGSSLALSIAAIWIAHIGLDRVLGYGLKYATGFADTHLGRLGRSARRNR
jgi:hypothetical protein